MSSTSRSTFHVTVTVKGDEMIVDWTGTDPQVRGPINATYGVTAGATYNAVFHLTDHHIPKNSGAYRPIRIIAPPGSAVNVVYPGPSVGGNTETHPKLADMVIAALAPALPDRVAAAEGGTACNFLFGGVHPKTGDYYANYHLEGGGWGAKSYDDGNDAIIVKNGNCRNTPVEIFETRFPLRVVEYSLIEGSGGPGHMRGGLGTRRDPARPGGRRGDLQRALRPHEGEAPARSGSTAAATAAAARSSSSARATPSSAPSRRSSAPSRPRSSRTSC